MNVGINVYFPRGFIRPDSKVFLNQENNNKVTLITNDTKLQINVFGKYCISIVLSLLAAFNSAEDFAEDSSLAG